MLLTVRLPVREPVVVGAKITLIEADWPAERERGRDIAAAVKPLPLAVTCEIDTVAFPVLVIVALPTEDVPVFKLPKLSEAGLAESCRTCEIPVPLRPMFVGEVGALLTKVSVPE